jgi:hypothetical protein
VHDDFGVTLGVELVAQGLQLGDQFLVVVDLAVEDHHHRAIFIEQRLLARGHVDDGQAPVAHAHAGLDVQAAFVGAAVGLRFVHAVQDRMRHRARRAGVKDAGDATHVRFPVLLRRLGPVGGHTRPGRPPPWPAG